MELFKEYSYEETLVEVAWIQENMIYRNCIDIDDSWNAKVAVFEIAQAFHQVNKGKTWSCKGDYYDAIFDFAEEELSKRFAR